MALVVAVVVVVVVVVLVVVVIVIVCRETSRSRLGCLASRAHPSPSFSSRLSRVSVYRQLLVRVPVTGFATPPLISSRLQLSPEIATVRHLPRGSCGSLTLSLP